MPREQWCGGGPYSFAELKTDLEEHIAQAMRKHSGHLRTGGSALEQGLEVSTQSPRNLHIIADIQSVLRLSLCFDFSKRFI